jgi:hypothetical protein
VPASRKRNGTPVATHLNLELARHQTLQTELRLDAKKTISDRTTPHDDDSTGFRRRSQAVRASRNLCRRLSWS